MEPNSVRYSILSVVVAAKSILIRTGSNLGRREERGKLRNDGVAEEVSETAEKGDRQGVSGRWLRVGGESGGRESCEGPEVEGCCVASCEEREKLLEYGRLCNGCREEAGGWAEVRGSDCEVAEERKEQLGRTWWIVEGKGGNSEAEERGRAGALSKERSEEEEGGEVWRCGSRGSREDASIRERASRNEMPRSAWRVQMESSFWYKGQSKEVEACMPRQLIHRGTREEQESAVWSGDVQFEQAGLLRQEVEEWRSRQHVKQHKGRETYLSMLYWM